MEKNLTTGSPTVTVGVLDSGIDPNHEDLKANLNTSLGQNYTDDGLAAWTDPVGHGTHVAGIIGAVGTTAAAESGQPHLHFAVTKDGKAVDPNEYLSG